MLRHAFSTKALAKPYILKNLGRNRGRGGKIRTCDPLFPKQVRYQAALRPDHGGGLLTANNVKGKYRN